MDNIDQIRAMVKNIADKNLITAGGTFQDLMASKVAAALDTRRQEIAASIFGDKPAAETASAETTTAPASPEEVTA